MRGHGTAGPATSSDLRVNDHPDPCQELVRLLDVHDLLYGSPDPDTLLPLDGALADEVRTRLDALGHRGSDGVAGLDSALASWAGIANLEERMAPGKIDPLVLAELRRAAPGGE